MTAKMFSTARCGLSAVRRLSLCDRQHLSRAEERFRVGSVVAHSRAAVGKLYAVAGEHALRLGRLHARAFVRVHVQLPRHDTVLIKGVLQELGGIVCVVSFKNPSADNVAAVDVHDHLGLVEDPRVPAGSEVCDVPRLDLIGLVCCIARRLGAHLALSRWRALTHELLLAEDAIERRQGAPKLSASQNERMLLNAIV